MSEVLAQLEKKGGGGSGELVTNYTYSGALNNREDTFTCNSSGTFYFSSGGWVSGYTRIWLNDVEQTATYRDGIAADYLFINSFQFEVNKGDIIKRQIVSNGYTKYSELGAIL